MLLLLNTTKTMNLDALVPSHLDMTEPCFLNKAQHLADRISKMPLSQLTDLMSLSDKLADKVSSTVSLWGKKDRPKVPAIFGFTGLLYKSLDVQGLEKAQLNDADNRVRILSGLYGLLRPFDLVESYRCEMGLKLAVGKAKNLAEFWKEILISKLNEDLKQEEAIISLAPLEYMKALDITKLNSPVISPVFKEKLANGKYRSVVVHSKKARGELVRYALMSDAQNSHDLMGFNAMGWKAAQEPPEEGVWLFTRPAGS